MTEPSIFIEKDFLKILDNFDYRTNFNHFSENFKLLNYEKLKSVLLNSKIICDLEDKELVRIFKKNRNNGAKPENWFDFLIFDAGDRGKLTRKKLDLNSTRTIFLLNKTNKEVENIVYNNNIICQGIEYDFSNNICYETIASVLVDKFMDGCEKLNHKTKNVIIVDPHIFNDASSKLEPKIPNVVKLLKVFELNNKNVNCHLSIITNTQYNDLLFNKKIKEIEDGLDNPKLTISVFAHIDRLFNQNRHIITDYFFMDLQHVFDRDDGSISGAFLFDNAENFKRCKHLLDEIKNAYIKTEKKTGVYLNKFNDILLNSIF